MRITYFSVSDQLGGSEQALLEMIGGVRRLRPGWRLHVVLPGHGPLLASLSAAGATCAVVPQPAALSRLGESEAVDADWTAAARARLCARLSRAVVALPVYEHRVRLALAYTRPDVVHTNGFKAHVLGSRAHGRAALVWHMHEYVSGRRLTRLLLRRLSHHPAGIVANSKSVADDVIGALGAAVPPRVIYNAVDTKRFAPSGPAADLDTLGGLPPAPPGTVRVGLVGTFGRWKGHEVFLRALAHLPPALAVRGYVIGGSVYDTEGSQRSAEELMRTARELGLAGRVGFTGFTAAPEAMRALDVVVHASTRPEPFGLVIAEAMACGRAVITTATGGAAELVAPGETALTHLPGSVQELAACIARLAGDRSFRADLGSRAKIAASRFDADRMAGELVSMYEEVAGRAPRAA